MLRFNPSRITLVGILKAIGTSNWNVPHTNLPGYIIGDRRNYGKGKNNEREHAAKTF